MVNNQQEIPAGVTSIDWFKAMKPDMTDEAINDQQTAEKQQQHTSKQVVNNQQEIPGVTPIDQFKVMKSDMTQMKPLMTNKQLIR